MTWTKLSDDFGDQLERLGLSRGSRLLHVEAYLYANRIGTDGRIERREVRKFSDATDGQLDELLDATWRDGRPLWEPIAGESDAWRIDWTDQEASDVVAERQIKAKDRKRRWRKHTAGSHDECTPSNCDKTRDETRDKAGDETRDETPTRPYPTRPAPKGAGQGRSDSASKPIELSTGDCSVCTKPEAECRARARTSGHDFTLGPAVTTSRPYLLAAVSASSVTRSRRR